MKTNISYIDATVSEIAILRDIINPKFLENNCEDLFLNPDGLEALSLSTCKIHDDTCYESIDNVSYQLHGAHLYVNHSIETSTYHFDKEDAENREKWELVSSSNHELRTHFRLMGII